MDVCMYAYAEILKDYIVKWKISIADTKGYI
jgi:hypothetical protein